MGTKENQSKMTNFIAFNNDFFDLLQIKLTGSEEKLFSRIYKETIGWRREESYLSNTYLESKVNLSLNRIRELLQKLVSYNMIFIRQVGKKGNIQQYIKININVNEYKFPEPKEKTIDKVKNFFSKKEAPKKEVYKPNEKIEINQISNSKIDSETPTNFGGEHRQISEVTPAIFGGIINSPKKNIEKHDHKTEKKEIHVMNDFKNFDINSLTENEKINFNILTEYGIHSHNSNFKKYLVIETEEIKNMIANTQYQYEQGKLKKSKQCFLVFLLNQFLENKKTETKEVFNNNESSGTGSFIPKNKNDLNTKALIDKFKKFFIGIAYASLNAFTNTNAEFTAIEYCLNKKDESQIELIEKLKFYFSAEEITEIFENIFSGAEYLRRFFIKKKEIFLYNYGV